MASGDELSEAEHTGIVDRDATEREAIDGQEPLTERGLRDVVRHERWAEQRAAWARVRP